MTTHIDHCGVVVVAAVRASLDGDKKTMHGLLHDQPHAVWSAVLLAGNLIECLNRIDPGHGDRRLAAYGLELANPCEETP